MPHLRERLLEQGESEERLRNAAFALRKALAGLPCTLLDPGAIGPGSPAKAGGPGERWGNAAMAFNPGVSGLKRPMPCAL